MLGDRIADAVEELVGRPHVRDRFDGELADNADASADGDQRAAFFAVLGLAVLG